MKLADLEARVRHMTWPAPPESLRARILSEAPIGSRSITWSDRMWFSRAWRLSMAATALALLTIQWLSGSREAASLAPAPQALAEAQVIDETSRQVGLPPSVAASLARRALAEAQARAIGSRGWTAVQLLDQGGARR